MCNIHFSLLLRIFRDKEAQQTSHLGKILLDLKHHRGVVFFSMYDPDTLDFLGHKLKVAVFKQALFFWIYIRCLEKVKHAGIKHSSKWWFDGDLPYGRIREKSPNKQIQVYGHKLGHILLWSVLYTHLERSYSWAVLYFALQLFFTYSLVRIAPHRRQFPVVNPLAEPHLVRGNPLRAIAFFSIAASMIAREQRIKLESNQSHACPIQPTALAQSQALGNLGTSGWCTSTCSFQHSIMEHCHSTYRVVGSKYHKGILLHFWFEIWSFLAADLPCWVGAVG